MRDMVLKLLLVILSGIFVGSSASFGADRAVKIHGRVLFEPTQQPLKDVRVELLCPDRSLAARIRTLGNEGIPEVLGVTKTDSRGKFSLQTTRPGPYEIVCQRPGRHFGSGVLNVDPKKFVLIQYKV